MLIAVAKEMGISINTEDENDFSTIALAGPPLSESSLAKISAEMNTDNDYLDEQESFSYLEKLRSAWKKGSK